MGCTTSLTISESSGNTGLDQAVYDSGTGKIFGVRGQWLFRFNATTGVKEAALQWCDDMPDFASLTVLNGKIYLGASFLPYIDLNWFGTEAAVPMDVYKVDAASFTRDGRTFFNAYRTPYDNVGNWNNPLFGVGYHLIITDGTYIYTAAGAFDPSNVANVGGNYHSLFPMGVEYDSFNGVIWFVDPYSTGGIGAAQSGLPATNYARTSGSIADPICGITYNAATNYAYVATGTESILKVSHVNTSTWANLTYLDTSYRTGQVQCCQNQIMQRSGG